MPTVITREMTTPDHLDWVQAAPFRSHVRDLIHQTAVPWPVIAFQAGLPLACVRTLLFGRQGRFRPKIQPQMARQLIELRAEDLQRLRHTIMAAQSTGARIRLLRSRAIPWDQIASHLELDEASCRALAQGQLTTCSALVNILAETTCELAGLSPTEDQVLEEQTR